MTGTTLQSWSKIIAGLASKGEVQVVNGAVKVKLVPRGSRRIGLGSARIRDGIASKDEARVLVGAVKVKVV